MRISIIQTALHWENPEANRSMLAHKMAPLKGKTDLVVLPEMFSTGFTMNTHPLAEPMDGPTMDWLRKTAAELDAAITGSFICKEGDRYYNRLVFMKPEGQYETYDKKHLFTLSKEQEHFVPGRKRINVEWRGWRICPLICYDLRFPAWSRNTVGTFVGGHSPLYDVLIYVANWPSRRAHHWRSLLTARAIENQSFVVGVNIAGADGNGFEYTGDSAVIDYSGQTLVQIPEGKEEISTIQISLEHLHDYRKQLPFLSDADRFEFNG